MTDDYFEPPMLNYTTDEEGNIKISAHDWQVFQEWLERLVIFIKENAAQV
jgi:hypothetical protein